MTAEPADKSKAIPKFRAGDTIRVHIKVIEGDSERVQAFEGVVLLRRGYGVRENFTVRKISFGVGVERTFPLQSPLIDKIDLVRPGKSRRARLYYLRNLKGRAARLEEAENASAQGGVSPASNSHPSGTTRSPNDPGPALASAPSQAKLPGSAARPGVHPGTSFVAR